MKKIIGAALAIGIVMGGVQAFGWGLPKLPGTGGDQANAAAVDVKALTARESALKTMVNKSTITLAKGLANIQRACGKAAEAAKLEATLEEVKKNPADMEGTKKLCKEVDNAGASLKQVDLNSAMNKDEARKSLGKSLLNLGAASILDVQASTHATGLITDISNGVTAVQAAPMSYGLSTLKDLDSGLSTARFVAGALPVQVTTITDLTKSLVKYAQTNKIEIPSLKDQENLAKELVKE